MTEDSELLRCYAEEKSETAFAELVKRRVGLVYSVALRQVGGDAHLAQDVTQRVFADLARKAAALAGRPVLSGWLYRSAQFAASDVVRSERRRRVREQENPLMNETFAGVSDGAVDWDKLRPVLDEALGELGDEDRDAVALRFLEAKSFAEIGRRLAVSEEAARKRVTRALEKLHERLVRRGVTSTTAALAVALGNQVAAAVPTGLAMNITATALAGAAAGGGVVAAGAFSFMSTTWFGAGAGVVAAVAVGVAALQMNVGRQREAELAVRVVQQRELQAKLADTEQRARLTARRLAEAEEDTARLLAAIQAQSRSAVRAPAVFGAVSAKGVETAEPPTHDAVQERYRRAQQLARTGDPAEALRELLWCFDTGMTAVTSFTGVRVSFLLSDIARLGERHPAALDALRARRDVAEKRLLASATDFEAQSAFANINQYLKEPDRTLAVFDQLPAGDQRRSRLALVAFDLLRERQRYSDAMEGRTFGQITQQFDRNIEERPAPAGISDPERMRNAQRSYAVTSTVKFVEILAGAGNLDQARTLAERLLAFDATAETRALLQTHLARAGQPALMAPPKN